MVTLTFPCSFSLPTPQVDSFLILGTTWYLNLGWLQPGAKAKINSDFLESKLSLSRTPGKVYSDLVPSFRKPEVLAGLEGPAHGLQALSQASCVRCWYTCPRPQGATEALNVNV